VSSRRHFLLELVFFSSRGELAENGSPGFDLTGLEASTLTRIPPECRSSDPTH
jgi:hypothetical protein